MTEPSIVDRAEQPYVGISRSVSMQRFDQVADRLPELIGWVMAQGVQPAGAPFFRYHLIAGAQRLDVEAGVPVAEPLSGEGEITPGVLPAGRYAVVGHHGHPDHLVAATIDLLTWGEKQGIEWDMTETPDGQQWGCRLESYFSDPRVVPDMDDWDTELAFKIAD